VHGAKAKLDAAGFWNERIAALLEEAKLNYVRRMFRKMRAPGGHRVFASVETVNDAGDKVRVYKQELLFNPEDYRQVVNYHQQMALHHMAEANGYAARCAERFNTQMVLPFPEIPTPD